jgi:hypothetical protein
VNKFEFSEILNLNKMMKNGYEPFLNKLMRGTSMLKN